MTKAKIEQDVKAGLVSDRKANVLDAAIKVFAQKGFHGATTLEIAKEAGVAEGTVFKYFATKKNLLLSIAAPAVVGAVFEGLNNAKELDGEEKIRNFVFQQFQLMKSNSHLVKLLIYESLFDEELKDRVMATIFEEVIKVLKDFYSQEVTKGVFRDIKPEVAVFCLAGMLGFYLTWQELLAGKQYGLVEEEEMLKGIAEIFLQGVIKK